MANKKIFYIILHHRNLQDQIIYNRDAKTTALAVLHPSLPWKCVLYNKLYMVLNIGIFAISVFLILYFSNTTYKYYKHYNQKKRDELFFMVERILDTLQSNATEDGDNFMVINHIRDMILPINNRKSEFLYVKIQFLHLFLKKNVCYYFFCVYYWMLFCNNRMIISNNRVSTHNNRMLCQNNSRIP